MHVHTREVSRHADYAIRESLCGFQYASFNNLGAPNGGSVSGTELALPFWLPYLLVALPTGLLWYIDRRRPPPGHCGRCGYNLTGNTSGVCPECGTAVGDTANQSEA